ncbi:MAG: hypothetical protein HUJ30_01900 [Gammaproteobacteria bacterium]|nr:hypothetical protein [Gammaproteobacteria bacterium]
MDIPRPPIKMVSLDGDIQLREVFIPDQVPEQDRVTATRAYAYEQAIALLQIDGYLFTCRSPSFGPSAVPMFDTRNEAMDTSAGVFVNYVIDHYQNLPITNEEKVSDKAIRQRFIQQIHTHYQRRCNQ